MTNKEEADISNEPGDAAVTALHLVGEVIDEANLIVNAAHESGQPWRYVSMLKSLRNGSLGEPDYVDMSYLVSKGDCNSIIKNCNSELVATSTPQKITAELKRNKSEASLVGQGDADNDTQQNELTKSSSFINNLFDMSEVENAHNDQEVNTINIVSDTPEEQDNNNHDTNEIAKKVMTSFMKSFVYTAISAVFKQHGGMINNMSDPNKKSVFIVAGPPKIANDVSFFLKDYIGNKESVVDLLHACSSKKEVDVTIDVKEETNKEDHENDSDCKNELGAESITACDPRETFTVNVDKEEKGGMEEKNIPLNENLYLTLNRDYEQHTEEVEQTTQDPNNMQLHEIELLTAQTSEINLSHPEGPQNDANDLAATSAVSASPSAVSKMSLVNRCRNQGTRLLSCIRGWWRRNTPSKKKSCRGPGSIRGICALSPDARRRASSLLDERKLSSSSSSQRRRYREMQKFNTINETLVKSSRWKNSYTFDVNFENSGE